MKNHYDVVIAGGAIIGSSIAHHLGADPTFRGSVLVVEKDPTYASSSTTKSASSIRQQFSTEINIKISQFGIDLLRRAEELLSVNGESTGIQFTERGYLLLANEQTLPSLRERVAFQQSHGVAVDLLGMDELLARYPWLNPDGLAGAATTRHGEGWFDAHILLTAFRRKAISNGVTYVAGEVTQVEQAPDGRVTGVRLADGTRVGCGTLVNATGAYAGLFSEKVGLRVPVDPHKRTVFVVNCPTELVNGTTVIDADGLTFRPEGRSYIIHLGPEPDNDPVTFDLDIDHGDFDARIWPRLAHRVPAFEALRMVSAWAGHYDFNPFDHNALLGAMPQVPNFIFANGFSGHGVMQAPAVGRGIAELIVHGRYKTLDLSPLSVSRYFENRPLQELNVY
jgi:glycine/D-amino acid oxidase-like deaminating enzyme